LIKVVGAEDVVLVLGANRATSIVMAIIALKGIAAVDALELHCVVGFSHSAIECSVNAGMLFFQLIELLDLFFGKLVPAFLQCVGKLLVLGGSLATLKECQRSKRSAKVAHCLVCHNQELQGLMLIPKNGHQCWQFVRSKWKSPWTSYSISIIHPNLRKDSNTIHAHLPIDCLALGVWPFQAVRTGAKNSGPITFRPRQRFANK
jgi:hypothetical protein